MFGKKTDENVEKIYEEARNEKVSELEILKQSLEEKKKQADDYYNQLLRLRAEFENFRKRSDKEKKNHLMWGKEEVLLKQINLVDVMEQACSSSKTSTNLESIQKGLELIYQEFVKMLASEGITEIKSLDEKFNPELHEALDRVESEKEDGTIVDVIQKGYTLNSKVIRHAKVKVAQNKKEEAEENK